MRRKKKIVKYRPYTKLKGVLCERGITYVRAATAVGMSTTSFNDKINGYTDFLVEELLVLCKVFDIDPAFILDDRLRNVTRIA